MIFRIGIENNNDGIRSIAWALEHPGCFAYGSNQDEAIASLPDVIFEYATWAAARGADWIDPEDIELELDEVFECYQIDKITFERDDEKGNYMVESWFLHDWKPLTGLDITRGLKLLEWSRTDLLGMVAQLDPEKLAQTYPNERWSIDGIARHIAGAEWWYLERLGLAFPQGELPKDTHTRLEKVRALLNQVLPTLENDKRVLGVEGELWSPRKLLRRALWHERDHIEHIRKLIG